jgi:hypothetical protein
MSKRNRRSVVQCRCAKCGTYSPPELWEGQKTGEDSGFLSFFFRCRHCGRQQTVFTGTPDRVGSFVSEMGAAGFVVVENLDRGIAPDELPFGSALHGRH